MRKQVSIRCLGTLVLAAVLAAPSARGAGFALYEMSARGNALGGAMIGLTGDASANYYNPANLTSLKGNQVMAGVSFIDPSVEVQTTVPTPLGPAELATDNDTHWWIPPHAYGSMQVSEKVWVGVGVYSPFGLGSVFDENWVGRYNSYKAIIETVDVNPNIAYKVDEKLSVAAGLQIMTMDLQLKRKLPNTVMPGGPDMNFELDGDSVGYGGNAAISYAVTESFGLGLVYRSEVHQSLDGDATLNAMGRQFETDAEGDVKLPASTAFGANYKVGDLTLGGAVTYTEWSSFDELRVKFANPAVMGRSESVTDKDWDNVWRYGVGAEYAVSEKLDVRCSYVYDEDPIPNETADYLVPSDNRQLLGAGLGWTMNTYRLDLGYTYLMFENRDNVPARPAEGIYPSDFKDGNAHILSVTLCKTF